MLLQRPNLCTINLYQQLAELSSKSSLQRNCTGFMQPFVIRSSAIEHVDHVRDYIRQLWTYNCKGTNASGESTKTTFPSTNPVELHFLSYFDKNWTSYYMNLKMYWNVLTILDTFLHMLHRLCTSTILHPAAEHVHRLPARAYNGWFIAFQQFISTRSSAIMLQCIQLDHIRDQVTSSPTLAN